MIDEIDEKILRELRRNAKAKTSTIGKRTAIPTTTVHNRIKRMEERGVIKTYVPVLDYKEVDRGIGALIFIVAEGKDTDQHELLETLTRLEDIEDGKILTGRYDIMLEARVQDMDTLNRLITEQIRHTEGVEKTQTMMILDEKK